MNKKTGLLHGIQKLFLLALSQLIVGLILFSPILLLVGGAYLGGRYYDSKDSKLTADGITTTAIVFDASYDQLGSLLQGEADNQMDRASYQRNGSAKCKIHYRFRAQNGQEIEGSINREYASLDAAKSNIGTEFEVVYSAADPTVYETAIGHTNTQADAMYWIAIAFAVIWGLCVTGCILMPFVKLLKPKTRKERIEQLKQKQK